MNRLVRFHTRLSANGDGSAVQAFPPGLQGDGEIREPGDGLQQALRTQAVQPERHARPGRGPGQQQGPRGILTEVGREIARALQALLQQGFQVVRPDPFEEFRRRFVGGQAHHQAIVPGDDVQAHPGPLFVGRLQGIGPGPVQASAPDRVQDDLAIRALRLRRSACIRSDDASAA
jgi:hypothetical protein